MRENECLIRTLTTEKLKGEIIRETKTLLIVNVTRDDGKVIYKRFRKTDLITIGYSLPVYQIVKESLDSTWKN